MEQINRFVIVVSAMVVIFVALLVVLLAWGAAAASIDRIGDFAGYLRDHNNREAKIIITLGAGVVVLLMLSAIIIEVTPSPTQKMRVRNVKSGDAVITTKQIAERIEAELWSVPHVSSCQAIVAARGKRVEVVLELNVDQGANLAETADAACGRAQTLVEERLGIALVQPPQARLHYRELRLQDERQMPDAMRREGPAGWERTADERTAEQREERGSPESPEEAQA